METINDVFNFLNQLEIYGILTGIELSTFNLIRKILIDEFMNVDIDKLVEILKNLDDLYIEYIKMKIFFDKSQITTLRNNIFEMYSENGGKIYERIVLLVCYLINGCKIKRII